MRNFAAITVAAVSLAFGAVGFAKAATGPDSTPTTTTAPHRPAGAGGDNGAGPGRDRRGPAALVGRTVHGELIVRTPDGSFDKVTVDRGSVTAVDAGSITLHRPDNVDVTLKLNDQTRFVGVDGASAVQKERPAMVVSKDGTATVVAQRNADGPHPARPARPGGRTTTTTTAVVS